MDPFVLTDLKETCPLSNLLLAIWFNIGYHKTACVTKIQSVSKLKDKKHNDTNSIPSGYFT